MESGIDIQKVIIQKNNNRRGSIDICGGMVVKRKLQNIHTEA